VGAKCPKGLEHAAGVVRRGLDPHIEILRVPRFGVESDGVSADQEVPD
jgi:hypothetical protein